jgi:hypothetical protein
MLLLRDVAALRIAEVLEKYAKADADALPSECKFALAADPKTMAAVPFCLTHQSYTCSQATTK